MKLGLARLPLTRATAQMYRHTCKAMPREVTTLRKRMDVVRAASRGRNFPSRARANPGCVSSGRLVQQHGAVVLIKQGHEQRQAPPNQSLDISTAPWPGLVDGFAGSGRSCAFSRTRPDLTHFTWATLGDAGRHVRRGRQDRLEQDKMRRCDYSGSIEPRTKASLVNQACQEAGFLALPTH
jgi:hypothetical protein